MIELNSNTYVSPAHKKAIFPSLKFYFKLINIVLRRSKEAKQNKFGDKEYLDANWEILHALESVGVKFIVEGIDNIRKLDAPAVFVGNHMSSLETMTMAAFIAPFRRVVFIMKQELLDYPVFGSITTATDPIAVTRENPREDLVQVFLQGKEKIKQGRSVVVFPQKTRTKFFQPSNFNTLGVKLAQKSNSYILPFALYTNAWGNGKLIKDFGKINPDEEVRFSFGEPFKIEGNSAEAHQKVLDFIQNKLNEWGKSELILK